MKSWSKSTVLITLAVSIAASLTFGCSLLQQRRRDPDCKQLFEQIEHGWFRDSTGLYQFTANAMAGRRFGYSHDDECLIGLAAKDVERLFGKPDTVYEGRMAYYQTAPCHGKEGFNANNCYCMTIAFDDHGGLKLIQFTGTFSDTDYIDLAPSKEGDEGK